MAARIVPIADPAQVCLVIASRLGACETGKRRQRMPWPAFSSAKAKTSRLRRYSFRCAFPLSNSRMNTIKIHPFLLLIAFAAGLFVYHLLLTQHTTRCALARIDSRLTRLEARDLEIENQKAKQQSRLACVRHALQFGGLICQFLGK